MLMSPLRVSNFEHFKQVYGRLVFLSSALPTNVQNDSLKKSWSGNSSPFKLCSTLFFKNGRVGENKMSTLPALW